MVDQNSHIGFRLLAYMSKGEEEAKELLLSKGYPHELPEEGTDIHAPSEVYNAYNVLRNVAQLRKDLNGTNPSLAASAAMAYTFALLKTSTLAHIAKDAGNALVPNIERRDPMRSEIINILEQGIPAKGTEVWRELVKRCGTPSSCCLNLEETTEGVKIVWRGASGTLNRLSKKNLSSRLLYKRSTKKPQ
jgi:hypothetical protein